MNRTDFVIVFINRDMNPKIVTCRACEVYKKTRKPDTHGTCGGLACDRKTLFDNTKHTIIATIQECYHTYCSIEPVERCALRLKFNLKCPRSH